MKLNPQKIYFTFLGTLLLTGTPAAVFAEDQAPPATQAVMPFTGEPDTHERDKKRIFPLLRDKVNRSGHGRDLPPPFGVMYITNWMDSDWKFTSASINFDNSPGVNIDAAQKATMDLQTQTNGIKADLWLFPFMDLMVGAGHVNVDAQLGLRDIPLAPNPGPGGPVQGDAIVPMTFSGDYYALGTVLAGAYERFYGAVDMSWVKTKLQGDASLSEDGFWTYTAAPKIGYNAGLSQIYVGARYISKNENFIGTVDLPSGQKMGFNVGVKTASWVGNFGLRTVIKKHWEILMESALGTRYQITGGIGYRW